MKFFDPTVIGCSLVQPAMPASTQADDQTGDNLRSNHLRPPSAIKAIIAAGTAPARIVVSTMPCRGK